MEEVWYEKKKYLVGVGYCIYSLCLLTYSNIDDPLARHRDLTNNQRKKKRKKKRGIDRHGICYPRRRIMTCSDRDVTLHACGGPEMDFGKTKFGRVTFRGDHFGLANYSSKQGVLCKLEQPGWDQGLKMRPPGCCPLRKV